MSAKYGNTSNLFAHLKNQHVDVYDTIKRMSNEKRAGKSSVSEQPTIIVSFAKTRKLSRNSKEHRELTKAVTFWLAKDMQPTSAVDKPGFKQLVEKLNPRYELPGRNHFSRTALPDLYDETRRSVQSSLSSGQVEFYAGTTDLWTSHATQPYITYTVHYIDSAWELKSYTLKTQYMPQDHTGENLKEAMLEILHDWNLPVEKQVVITTDSGSNRVRACQLLGWKRLSCFGHLAIHKALDDRRVERVLRVCRQVVAKFSQSWKKTRELTLVQEEKKLPKHKLKTDCPGVLHLT